MDKLMIDLKVFKSVEQIIQFIDKNKINISFFNRNEVLKKIEDYILCETKEKLVSFSRKIDKIYKFSNGVNANLSLNYSNIGAKIVGISTISILAAGLISPWTLPFIAIGSLLYGHNKLKEQVAKKAFQISEQIYDNVTSEIKKIILEIEEEGLNKEQIKIKHFLETRGIRYLVHFTSQNNLQSILKKGLLSYKELINNEIVFDYNDDKPEFFYISLSIEKMNTFVLKNFKEKAINKEFCLIYIDASILYREIQTPRIYCQTNSKTIEQSKGSYFSDLEAMFSNKVCYELKNKGPQLFERKKQYRKNQTTDVQAEIQWGGPVSLDYFVEIKKIVFDSTEPKLGETLWRKN